MSRWLCLSLSLGVSILELACATPECATPVYTDPECRVVAENELARARLGSGVEVRFQRPGVFSSSSWDATGLIEPLEGALVRARVAGPGAFAISFDPPDDSPASVEIILDNVDSQAVVSLESQGGTTLLPNDAAGGLRRRVEVPMTPGETTWIRGERVCPATFRLAFTADIQTNPLQFDRVIDRIALDAEEGERIGEPLVGLLIAGDLSDASREDEFKIVDAIARRSAVPVAVTAGNHDVYRPQRPLYNRHFGPGNYVMSICGLRIVMLDTGSGAIADSVAARLPELFDRPLGERLIVGMHHPPHAGLTGAGWSREDAASRLLAEAAIASVDLIIAGHSHALHDFGEVNVGDRVLREIISGTAGAYQGLGTPRYGYVRITVAPEGLTTCFVETPPPGLAAPQNDELSDRLPYCE